MSNGKAIVRTEQKGLFEGMQDGYRVPHFDFYVVDLAKQTTLRLDLPLDKGTAHNCVLVENGLVYITVNPDTGSNYVWVYAPKPAHYVRDFTSTIRSIISCGWNG